MRVIKNKTRSALKKIFVYMLLLIAVVIVSIQVSNYNKNLIPEHRLQWWRDYIDCDKYQAKLTGKGITIAILDTGVDFTHKDLNKCKHEQLSVFKKITNENVEHGTVVAGILASYPYDSKGALGIVPEAKIVSIDVANSEKIQINNLIKGIKMAIDKRVDIINISLGLHKNSKELYKWIKKAYDKQIVIVASAGNYMKNDVLYPAKYDEVIAVGSYDKKGNIMSPKGKVDNVIFMPGDSIVSTVPDNKYVGAVGNSFSTAIMTGIIAQIKEKYPNINNNQIYATVNKFFTMPYRRNLSVDEILEKAKGEYKNEK